MVTAFLDSGIKISYQKPEEYAKDKMGGGLVMEPSTKTIKDHMKQWDSKRRNQSRANGKKWNLNTDSIILP